MAFNPAVAQAVSSAVQAGSGVIGGWLTAVANKKSQSRANKEAAKQSHIARNWEEQMSDKAFARETDLANTAYQRSSADMKAAGFNPMMMYGGQGGGPSATPHSSSPSSGPAEVGAPKYDFSAIEHGISQAVSSAQEHRRIEIEKQAAQAGANRDNASAAQSLSQAAVGNVTAKALAAELPAKLVHGKLSGRFANFDFIMKKVNDMIGTVTHGLRMFATPKIGN